MRHLAEAKDDELEPVDSKERYSTVARELGYDVLGKPMDDAELEESRA